MVVLSVKLNFYQTYWNHTSISSCMFVILMNVKKNNLKVALCKLGLIYSKGWCWQTNADRMFYWFYLKLLQAYYEIKSIETSKTMKGNVDSKLHPSILWYLGIKVNKVTHVTPENIRISFKKLSFLTHNWMYENINIWQN